MTFRRPTLIFVRNNNNMETISQYDAKSRQLFQNYLNDNSFDLVGQLKKLERKIKRELGSKGKKSLWFKLCHDDTLATGINNVEDYVTGNDSRANIELFLECIQIGLDSNTLSTKFS